MIISYKAFILPHVGDPFRLCADRFAIGEKERAFAISDGVGNSLFPEVWAQSLCEDYVKTPGDFICENKLSREDDLISHWESVRDERVASFTPDQMFIYEMGLDKADFAAATFVGLRFLGKDWHCLALGDSYLVVLDKDFNVIQQVASMEGRPFDNYPEYFASKKGYNNGIPVFRTGCISEGQYFLLMSDAISDWFLAEDRTTDQRKALLDIKTHEEYCSFIGSLRSKGELKDDDTTIVALSLEDDDSPDCFLEKKEVDNIEDFIENDVQAPGEEVTEPTDEENHNSDDNPTNPVNEEPQKDSVEDSSEQHGLATNSVNESTQAATDKFVSKKDVQEGLADTTVTEDKPNKDTSEDLVVPGKDEAEIEKLQMQLDRAEADIVTLNERIQEKDNLINELIQQNKQLKDDINRLLEKLDEMGTPKNFIQRILNI